MSDVREHLESVPSTALPAPAREQPWRHLHPLTPLMRGGLFVIVLVGIVVANARDYLVDLFIATRYFAASAGRSGNDFPGASGSMPRLQTIAWAGVTLILVLALIVGVAWLIWRSHTFRITDEVIESRQGVIVRRHLRAPLERVQSVHMKRPLLARAVGLTQVQVQTAGQSANLVLQFLGHREAKQLRDQLLQLSGHGAHAAPALAVPTSPEEDSIPENSISVPAARLIGSIVLSTETLLGASTLAAVIIAIFWMRFSAVAGVAVTLGSFAATAIIVASALVTQFNSRFNFTLTRAKDDVGIGAGLTSTVTETIPLSRIHAVELRQPLMWRPLGWWQVRMIQTGTAVSVKAKNAVPSTALPVAQLDDALRACDMLLDERHGSCHYNPELKHSLTSHSGGFLGAGRGAIWLLWLGARRAGVRVIPINHVRTDLHIRRGWLTRSISIIPLPHAQSVQLSRPFGHRLFGLATIQVHTVPGPVNTCARGIALAQAQQVFDTLASAVAQEQR